MAAQLSSTPIEVRRYTPALRVFSVGVWLAAGCFFAYLAHANTSRGHELGYLLAVLQIWPMLYTLRVPAVAAAADASGITYTDASLGLLLIFTTRQAAWIDVTEVHSKRVFTRAGSFLRTRITVRDEGRARKFFISSRCSGYPEFLAALREATAGLPVATTGLGADPILRQAQVGAGGARQVLRLVVVGALGILVLILALLNRR